MFRPNKFVRDVLVSFEAGEQTTTKLFFPAKTRILKIRGIVMKAIAATDTGTITFKDSAAAAMTAGVITAGISDALNTAYSVTPSDHNLCAKDDFIQFVSAKSTAGGKVLVSLECELVP